jgi:hypothetical protein
VKRKKKGIKVNLDCLMTKQLRGKRQILLPINSEGISHKKKRPKTQETKSQRNSFSHPFPLNIKKP